MENIVLEARNITKRFPGVVALSNVNFRLVKGKVHALMGENGAGKSTLMKIIAGIYQADEGEVLLHGEKVMFHTPKQALDHGISMIHQELSPILDMTIAENLFLGKEFCKGKLIDYKKMNSEASSLLEKVGINLKEDGKCIVYITHKMDEVFRIADEITVFRDGKYIGTYDSDEIDENQLVVKMVDRELTEIYPVKNNQAGEEVLRVEGLSQKGVFENISFSLKKGEILGFSGLMGSGRTEVMNALFGITQPTSGQIYIKGEKIEKPTPRKIISKGVGYVTEDRKGNGLVLDMSVYDNTILPSLSKLSNKAGVVNKKKATKVAEEYRDKLSIKTPSMQQRVKQLSGGNQQKIVLAKWLLQNPDILIFDEPTRGIDVGAKTEIYKLIAKLAEEGKAIIFISSEMPEILGLSDRVLVFYEGNKKGELTREEATQERIMMFASDVEEGGTE